MRKQGRLLTMMGVAARTALCIALGGFLAAVSQAQEPIKIGFGMAMTGPLGCQRQVGAARHEDLGRGHQQERRAARPPGASSSTTTTRAILRRCPALYAKLLDVDKVDMIVSGYATNMIAPAMPVAMQRKKVFPALFGTGVNSEFKYDKYFAMIPTGPNPKPAFTKPFFDVVVAQSPKPETISLAAADAEFGRNVCDGARENAKAAGLKIVYDKTYPPPTTDFAPIVRAIQATNPDIAVFCSYPLELGWPRPRHQRGRLQGEGRRRRHGRHPGHRYQATARTPAQWHHQLRDVGAVQDHGVPWRQRVPGHVPGACRRGGRRSARLLPRHLGLCVRAARRAGHQGRQQPR